MFKRILILIMILSTLTFMSCGLVGGVTNGDRIISELERVCNAKNTTMVSSNNGTLKIDTEELSLSLSYSYDGVKDAIYMYCDKEAGKYFYVIDANGAITKDSLSVEEYINYFNEVVKVYSLRKYLSVINLMEKESGEYIYYEGDTKTVIGLENGHITVKTSSESYETEMTEVKYIDINKTTVTIPQNVRDMAY